MLILSLFIPLAAIAEHENLISGDIDHGGFGGPLIGVSRLGGETVILSGGRGAWLIDHRFFIGGGGYNLSSELQRTGINPQDPAKAYKLQLNYGGLEFGAIFEPEKLVHYTVMATIGRGTIRWVELNDATISFQKDDFLLVEPHAGVEMNVVEWMRLCLGASYRYAINVRISYLTESDINGFSARLTLKFGSF